MPSQNITALTNYAGGQAPADLIYIGKSPFGATDDRKSTLNDFLSIITKNITDGALRFGQFAAPALSAANAGAIYFDSVSKTFQVSENGGAYIALKTLAAGSVNEIQYNGGSGAFAANAAFTYDSTTNTVSIGAAGLTGKLKLTHTNTRTLTIQPGVQSAARTFTWMTGYGNAQQCVITDGFGNLSYGDFIPYPLPGVGDEVLYNAAGSLGASSQFQWNDTARVLSFVTGAANASIYFNTSVSTANIKFQSSAGIPGSQAGLIFPYIGGNQTSGHGLWWSDGTYLNTSRFNLQLGFNFQGAASSTSPLKIRKATGTSADGNIVFAFFPDSGFFDLQPFGISAGETTALRFSELAANGTNYIEFKAPDALTGNTTFTWPNGAGSAGQVLTTNGSNTLSWSTVSGGGLTVGTTAIASGTAGRILYETAGNLLGETAGFSYQPAASPNLTITAQAASYVGLRINSAATPSVNIFETTVNGTAGSGFVVTSTGAPSSTGGATNSERYGAGSTITSTTDGYVFGTSSTINTSNNSIAIGKSLTVGLGGTASKNILISPTGGYIGNASSVVVIGFATGTNGINNGSARLTLIGETTGPISASDVVLLNASVTGLTNNTFVVGGAGGNITNWYGNGVTNAAPTSYTINGTGGSGSNIAGADINIAGGRGTGTGIPGTIGMQFARAGSTSSTLNTLSDEWRASYSTTDTVTLTANIKTSTTTLTSAAAINALWTTATHASRTAAITFSVVNNAAALSEVFRIAPTALTLADAVNFIFNTTTGTKIATATGQKIGFWNASPVVQPTSAALTNNVTSGGTANTISDYSDLTVYATDAGTIRDNFYQLALKLKEISDALRLIGILG